MCVLMPVIELSGAITNKKTCSQIKRICEQLNGGALSMYALASSSLKVSVPQNVGDEEPR